MHPVAQVVFLGCLVLTFMAMAAFAGVLWVSGGDLAASQRVLAGGERGLNRRTLLVMNNMNQLLAFLGAGWVFAGIVGLGFLGRFFMKPPRPIFWLLAAVIALGMSPLMDWSYRLNEWALVPGSALHAWAGSLEAQAMAMTRSILAFSEGAGLGMVLVSVALLPALCEEWLFRGTLQPLLIRASGNIHVGIWISAALFSAIHMQFFGFIPRMLLGASFGYLVVHSGSIWPAVTGHLVNNAGVVIAAAWMGPEWLEQGLEPQPLATWDAYDWGQAAVALLALGWAGKRLFALGRPEAYLQALDTET